MTTRTAKTSNPSHKWVTMIEAARMIVRLDQAGRFHLNNEVFFALFEASARAAGANLKDRSPSLFN